MYFNKVPTSGNFLGESEEMKVARITEKKKRKAERKSRRQSRRERRQARKERRLRKKHKRQVKKSIRQAKASSSSSSSDEEQVKGKGQNDKEKIVEKMMEATKVDQQQSTPKRQNTANKKDNNDVSRCFTIISFIKI